MIGFGSGNEELGGSIAPFMLGLVDNLEHDLRVFISPSVEGEPGVDIDLDDWPASACDDSERGDAPREIIYSSKPVYTEEGVVYEVRFDGYVLFMQRDESYTTWDDYETREGTYLVRFTRSRLLDSLGSFTFANDRYPGPLTHYGIYCEDHLLDVITDAEPTVRRMTPDEIEAWDFFKDES